MKHFSSSKDLSDRIGASVIIVGHLHHLRELKSVAFLVVRDRCGLVQVVIENRELIDSMSKLYHETALEVSGTVVSAPQVSGGIELHGPSITVLSPSVQPPPVNLFQPEINALLPTILDHAPLALRHPTYRAISRLTSASVAAFREALRRRDFIEINTPKIVGNATESGANVFALDYFGRNAYLAQSPQMYKQIMVGVHDRVFETAPVFRAEPHATKRHLNEYISLDMEMGFIEDHHEVMAMLEYVVKTMVTELFASSHAELEEIGATKPEMPDHFPVISFIECKELYLKETGTDTRHENDLSPEEERCIGQWALDEHSSAFVFVEGYPMSKRPFYTFPSAADPLYSNSFDLLFRGLELVTGGQRLNEYSSYLEALESRGMNPGEFSDYLEVFKYGMPRHGGFGLGLERWVAQLVGCDNIRHVSLFPRDRNRLSP